MYRIGFLFLILSRLLAIGFVGLAGFHVYTAMTTGQPVMPEDITGPEGAMALLFGMVFLGMVVAWFRESLGGWLIVFGMTLIYVSEYLWSYVLPDSEIYMVMMGTGFMFILSSGMIGGFAN